MAAAGEPESLQRQDPRGRMGLAEAACPCQQRASVRRFKRLATTGTTASTSWLALGPQQAREYRRSHRRAAPGHPASEVTGGSARRVCIEGQRSISAVLGSRVPA
ncbi:hypothetical protein PHYPSEUDO_001136 [Phytophthora pseudosyringae]|uniref:Uncharacterized protein n=1 Tax=Phytophthora pseudosyringae TaxID=221518 RepID=A0A8T1V2E2_9STRA|nr:hypothetical protein PHYPSEUDO_001136 [Phytophthora pseudosyringae]